MSVSIRAAGTSDLKAMVGLLLLDAEQRRAADPTLWKLAGNAREKVASTLRAAIKNENPPIRQRWLLAEYRGEIVGIAHTIILPVPPIYAGELGAPGLIMEDCLVSASAPEGADIALLKAAEADLIGAGAKVLVASSVADGAWQAAYSSQGYEPLTLYLAKVGLGKVAQCKSVRAATEDDVRAIVASSADNRRILHELDAFWKPHPEADVRFGGWMKRSLTLDDRDMFIAEAEAGLTGYAIAQPATALHFPAAHDIGGTGFIDDYYATGFAHPGRLEDAGNAAALLSAAEAALKARGNTAALIVCPAAWASKLSVLEAAGYRNAITWYIKR